MNIVQEHLLWMFKNIILFTKHSAEADNKSKKLG